MDIQQEQNDSKDIQEQIQQLNVEEASSSSIQTNKSVEQQHEEASNILAKPSSAEELLNAKIIIFFKNLFKQDRTIIQYAAEDKYTSKSTFLSLIRKHQDTVRLELKTSKIGPAHHSIFNTEAILHSKKYGNVTLKADAAALRKKQAEGDALYKLANLLYK